MMDGISALVSVWMGIFKGLLLMALFSAFTVGIIVGPFWVFGKVTEWLDKGPERDGPDV